MSFEATDLNNALSNSIINEQLYGKSDALLYADRSSVTRNGVTFTFNADGSCSVNGTASATAYVDYFASATSFPAWLIPGMTYDLDYSGNNVYFRIITYTSGTPDSTNLVNARAPESFTVPAGKSGITVRLVVPNGRKASGETVDPHLFIRVKNLETFNGTSVDDIDANNMYLCDGSSVSGLPNNANVFVVDTCYTSVAQSSGQQNAYNFSTGDRWWRRKTGGTWETWRNKDNTDNLIIYEGGLPNNSDCNTIQGNSIWLLGASYTYTNLPTSFTGGGHILTLEYSATLAMQITIELNSGAMYYRIKSGVSGTWKNWISYSDAHNLSIGTKYVAFGDSLTWGAVWDMDQTTQAYRAAVKYQIPTRIANAIGMIDNYENMSIGGAGYYAAPSGNVSVTDAILAYDFTDTELVTIMSGVNDKADASHPLGTADNPASGTICGAIKQIIDHLAENYPRVQVVFIQPTPSGHLSDLWGGRLAGGWSMNDFDEQVGKLCHNEHVGYVGWWESVFAKQWDSFSGGYSYNPSTGTLVGPNYSHPTNERDYAMIGDFIAGKVASLFHGKN